MLTVKIVKPDATEEIFEAGNVEKEKNGIMVRGRDQHQCDFYGPGGQMYALDAGIRLNDHSPPPQQACATAYIMNRFGSTVATYHL